MQSRFMVYSHKNARAKKHHFCSVTFSLACCNLIYYFICIQWCQRKIKKVYLCRKSGIAVKKDIPYT